MGTIDYGIASDRALTADLFYHEARRPEAGPHPLDQLDRGNGSPTQNRRVRNLVGDVLAELPPSILDDIADAIHFNHQTGCLIDHAAIGKSILEFVTRRVVS